jgi:hypothetical protein
VVALLRFGCPTAVDTSAGHKLIGLFPMKYETLDFVNARQQAFQFSKTPRIAKKELDTPVFQDILNKKKPIKFEDKQNQHFEYYYPFQNKPECQMCHGQSKDLLGVLQLKISTADLNMQIKL